MTVRWYYLTSEWSAFDPAWLKFLLSIKNGSIVDRYEVDVALEPYNAMQSVLPEEHYILFDSEQDLSWFLLRWS